MDPQLFGPPPLPAGGPSLDVGMDGPLELELTNPLQDAYLLATHPRRFFEFFRQADSVNDWVGFKAIFGLLFAAWLAHFAVGAQNLAKAYNGLVNILGQVGFQDWFKLWGLKLNMPAVQHMLLAGVVTLAQLQMILAPLATLFFLLLLSGMTALTLPLFGVKRHDISFGSIFFAFAYAHWWLVLGVIPFVGPLLAFIVVGLMCVYAIKWIFQLGFWESAISIGLLLLMGEALALAAFSVVLTVVATLFR